MAMGAGLAAGLLVAGMVGLAACGPAADDSWTVEAQAWIDGYDEAFEAGELEHQLYYAADAAYDGTMVKGRTYDTDGRDRLVRLNLTDARADITRGELYLGPGDAVRTMTWDFDRFDIYVALVHLEIGADGIERETLLAPNWMQTTIAHGQSDAAAAAWQVAADYLAAWSGRQPELIRGLYAPAATVSDALVGASVQGHAEIVDLAAGAAPIMAGTVVEVFPEEVLGADHAPSAETPAVFLKLEFEQPRLPSQVWLVVRSPAPCPGSTVVALQVDDEQLVTQEQRFHAAEALGDCWSGEDARDSWWSGRSLPTAFGERVTGWLETDAGSVEIRNGSEATDALLQWAVSRFQLAQLPIPAVSSITFDPFHERCGAMPGYADWSEGTTAVLICRDSSAVQPSSDGGTPPLGHLVLHEVGHAWIRQHTDEATRQAFMERVGTDNWNDTGELWRERGVEWAAETLSWGLKGSGRTSVPLASPPCDLLADGFRILTGAEPLTQCPVADQG
jgi:hypothetical protein